MENILPPGTVTQIQFQRPKSRVTVVQTISHEQANRDSEGIWCGFSRELQSDEQIWERVYKVTEEWSKLDCGWFTGLGCSHVLVRNQEGKSLLVNPSFEQRQQTKLKILELSFDGGITPHCLIAAGEVFRVTPVSLDQLALRCRSGQAEIILNIFPE